MLYSALPTGLVELECIRIQFFYKFVVRKPVHFVFKAGEHNHKLIIPVCLFMVDEVDNPHLLNIFPRSSNELK